MEITRCGIHGFHETLGIDVDEIRVFWTLEADQESAFQSAYSITISEVDISEGFASPGTTAFISGKITSAAQRNILCRPRDGFKSVTNYLWRVTVWDQDEHSWESKDQFFFTAYPRSHELRPMLMNQPYGSQIPLIFRTWFEDLENKWNAWWIGNGDDKPLYLRRTFALTRPPWKAVVFVSGLGHCNLRVNGEPASENVLDPGWTDYHKTVQFVAHDITSRLHEGTNVLAAHVGNGFYAADQGNRWSWLHYDENSYVRWANELCFLAELHLFFPDGSHEIIVSDANWKVKKSATTLANVYASETHDRRLYPTCWDLNSYDDRAWASAEGLRGPRGFLRYQSQPPIVRRDYLKPVAVKSPRPGVVCFDLGQNASTLVKIVVSGKAGSEVTIRYAETAYDDGTVKMPDPNFQEAVTNVYNTFYLAGAGLEEWEPDFCFTSARYIQVEGVALQPAQGLPCIHSVIGQHISSACRKVGTMVTDKPDVNDLLTALDWTFASNMFSYHTDCPQIEKFAWLEVTHLLFPATQYIRDIEALHTKIVDDILDAQLPSGLIPTTAPETRYMCGPFHDTISWGCALLLIPDHLRRYYGSTNTIPKVYEAGKRYMNYIRGKERRGGLIEYGLGDWGRGLNLSNLQANIETAFYYKCLRCMENFAEDQALPEDAAYWKGEAERISEVYIQHLLVTNDPSRPYAYFTSLDNPPIRDRDAVSQAVALQFGLVPSQYRSDVAQAFLDDVADGKLRAGEIGLPFLLETLRELNRLDLVVQMARQEEHPSYMRFLRRGETTLPEFWDDNCRSKCHDMLGSIQAWFYAAVLGLEVMQDGYKMFRIAPPYSSEFNHVEGSFESPYGLISIKFDRTADEEYELRVTVPLGTRALIAFPKSGMHITVERRGGSKGALDGENTTLGSGSYLIQMSLRR